MSLICQLTSEDIKHQLIIIIITHSFTRPPIHPPTPSLFHSFTHSFTLPLIYPLLHPSTHVPTPSFTHLLIYPLLHPLIHLPLLHPLTYLSTPSPTYSFLHSFTFPSPSHLLIPTYSFIFLCDDVWSYFFLLLLLLLLLCVLFWCVVFFASHCATNVLNAFLKRLFERTRTTSPC